MTVEAVSIVSMASLGKLYFGSCMFGRSGSVAAGEVFVLAEQISAEWRVD